MAKSFAVFISGNGSNLEAIIEACQSGQISAQLAVVVSNKPDAYGLTRARLHHIPAIAIPHQAYESRQAFEKALLQALEPYRVECIVLAGFMRQLTPYFLEQFQYPILNIHPSLLPKYPGLHTHQRALEAKDKEHGVTIHLVTDVLDGGPILAQESFEIEANDTIESLKIKAHQIEHRLYPRVITEFFQQDSLQPVD